MEVRMDSINFVRGFLRSASSIDQNTVDAAKLGLLDYLSSSLMAANEMDLKRLCTAFSHEQTGNSLLVGTSLKTSPSFSALYNGLQAHLLDIDDVHSEVRGHPSAVILSALLAVSTDTTSGEKFLTAYIIGLEIMSRLGKTVNPYHYERGFHSTGTLGGIAAAGAISVLFQFDDFSTAKAMSIAATQSSGLRMQFGTPVKPLHAGFAARSAVEAVALMKSGFSAEPDFLFHPNGFLAVYAEEKSTNHVLDASWGEKWSIVNPGLWFKQYPFCSAAMSGAEAAILLNKNHHLKADQIYKIEVGFFLGKDAALSIKRPDTGESGRFSIEYIVWLGITGQPYNLSAFSSKKIDTFTKEKLRLVHRYSITDQLTEPFTEVIVYLNNGTTYKERVTYPKGSPENPLTLEDEKQKIGQSISSKEFIQTIIEEIDRLPFARLGNLLTLLKTVKIQ